MHDLEAEMTELGGIRAKLERAGATMVVTDIRAGTRSGQCAREIRNLQGSCGLGNAPTVVEQLENERRERAT